MRDRISLLEKAKGVRLLVLDVDGVLTDGAIVYDHNGNQIQGFFVRDGLGIKLLMEAGVKVAIISARSSKALSKRSRELGIDMVYQGEKDKVSCLKSIMTSLSLSKEQVCGIGDDLVDLPFLGKCGLSVTVNDAPSEVKEQVDFVTENPGGRGAVREVCELILKAKGIWQEILSRFQ